MSTQFQLRRGNSTQTNVFTGAEGEVTVNTTNKSVVVHDGITQGGFEVARVDLINIDNDTFAAKANAAGITGGGGGGALTATVANISQANPGVVTTSTDHEFSDGQQVTFTDVSGMTELNGNSYFCDVLTGNTFALYTDPGLTSTLNTTGFFAYTSGGNVVATTAPGAPTTASYVVISANPVLQNERVLTPGAGIVLQDGGAGGGATLSANLASTVPSNLGSASAGAANTVSRSDHVHAMPTAIDVGAVPNTRTIIAGNGLTGGGVLSSNVTVSLNAGLSNLNDVVLGNVVNGDVLVYNNATSRWENTQNLPRMTLQSQDSNVGTQNAVKTLSFTGSAVANGQVVVSADTDPTRVIVTIPEIFTQERVEDIVGGMVSGSSQSGISVTYDDPSGKINFQTNNFTIGLTGDVTGTATVTNLGNVTVNTTIAANSVALGGDTTGNYVASLAPSTSAGVSNTISLTNLSGSTEGAAYTIALNTSSPDYIESVQDIAAGILDQNAGDTGITAVYNDSTAKTTLSAKPFSITLGGDLSGTATVSNLGNVTINAQINSNSVALGTDTTGNYVSSVAPSTSAGVANTITVTNTAGTGEGAAYTVALNTSSADYIESVQDIAAGILDQNAGAQGITAVYNDSTGKTTLSAKPFSITLGGDLSGTATVANLGNVTINAQINSNSVALGTDTTGNYVQQVTVSGSGITMTPATAGEGTNVAISLASASTNSPSSLVFRDTNGSFSANVITASLNGSASQNVLKSGDTMTGALILSANPTSNLQAATKAYVDSTVAAASFVLNTTAGTGSGTLINGDTLGISGGTGITTSLTGDTFTITNNGVTSISAGAGISVSAATGAITISATGVVAGVSSVNSQTGPITLQGTSGKIEITQPSSGVIRITIPDAATFSSVTASSVVSSSVSATGNLSGANVNATSAVFTPLINKTGSNGVGNIGSAANYFNTVFAKATSAQYADLAELYQADNEYEPGTVVSIGGSAEITICNQDADTAVVGVVSTDPAYLMNTGMQGDYPCQVALVGRVPCKVTGLIKRGSLLVSAGNGLARAEKSPLPGTIIGKALQDFNGESGVIEVLVGRF